MSSNTSTEKAITITDSHLRQWSDYVRRWRKGSKRNVITIVEYLNNHPSETYTSIGERFGVTRQAIEQTAMRYGCAPRIKKAAKGRTHTYTQDHCDCDQCRYVAEHVR